MTVSTDEYNEIADKQHERDMDAFETAATVAAALVVIGYGLYTGNGKALSEGGKEIAKLIL